MAKRQRLTVEEVLETMHSDFEDDPDEPTMEGSGDEFSDLEMSDGDNELDPSSSCTQLHQLTFPTTQGAPVLKVRPNINNYV